VNRAKTAEPIEMPFGLKIRVGSKNHVLHKVLDPSMGMGNYKGGKAARCKI